MATKMRLNLSLTPGQKKEIEDSEIDRIDKEYTVKINKLLAEKKDEIEKMKKIVADMSAVTSDFELKKPKKTRTKKLLVRPYEWADEEIDSLVVYYEQSLTTAEISSRMKIPVEDVKTQITKLKNDGHRLLRKEYKKQEIKPTGEDIF